MRRAELGRDLVVGAHQSRPGCARDEPIEGEEQGLIGAVELEMIRFDVGEHDGFARQLDERAVALVRLDHEPFAVAPDRAAADLVHVAADDERRVQVRLVEHQGEHRGGRRLSVRAGDGDSSARGRDGREHVGSPQHRHLSFARGDHFAIPFGYRGRDRHEVEIGAQVVRTVTDEDLDAFGAQALETGGLLEIASGDAMAHGRQHARDRAHAGAADTHDVDRARTRQIDRMSIGQVRSG